MPRIEILPDLPASLSGFNLCGVLRCRDYDALVPEAWRVAALLPGARAVVVLATGGPDFFSAFARARSAGDPRYAAGARDPLDAFAEEALRRGAEAWSARGFETRSISYRERQGDPGVFADFVGLGQAGGLGTPSRLGLLLHPQFGPWMAIRAIWLTARRLDPTPAIVGLGPCQGCPAPCSAACPVAAPAAQGFDALRCRAEREGSESCRSRCDARRACVIGQEHAYAADGEAHHMRAAPELPVGQGASHRER